MTRHKGELSNAAIDREWPHQVALHAGVCTMDQFHPKHDLASRLGCAPRGRIVNKLEPTGHFETYKLYCFRRREDAQAFIDVFGGRHFHPVADREGPKSRNVWKWREWGDPAERYPEIVARLERKRSWEPSLDADIRRLLGIGGETRFTRSQPEVEAFLAERLPQGAWEVMTAGEDFDARLRLSAEAPWHYAWSRRISAPDNEATALTLAYLRAIGDSFARPVAQAA